MKSKNKMPLKRLHMEISAKCMLKCPLCPRYATKDRYKDQELDFGLIKRRLNGEVLAQLEDVCLSGVYGDPIYHSRFLDVIEYIKGIRDLPVSIETNGSHKTAAFWERLSRAMNHEDDTIIFSIDGLEDTNPVYRKNSNWEDIMSAIKTTSGKMNTVWKFIRFKHNEHQVEIAKQRAKDLGMNKFIMVESSFGDMLEDEKSRSKKSVDGDNNCRAEKIFFPRCKSGYRHYISADGYLGPCCWLSQYRTRRELYRFDIDYSKFDLNEWSIMEIINSKEMQKIQELWVNEEAPCRQYCSKLENEQKEDSVHEKINILL